jgi:hypothetical protein
VRPTVEFFTTRLPILSDIAPLRSVFDLNGDGQVTMIEVVSVYSGDERPAQLVQTLADILAITRQFRALPDGQLWVDIGAFDLGSLDPRARGFSLSTVTPVGTAANPLEQPNAATDLIRSAQQTLRSDDGRGFRFTLLENPASIFPPVAGTGRRHLPVRSTVLGRAR